MAADEGQGVAGKPNRIRRRVAIATAVLGVVALLVLATRFDRELPGADHRSVGVPHEPGTTASNGSEPASGLDLPAHWSSPVAPGPDQVVLRIDDACARASGLDGLASVSDNLRRRLSVNAALAMHDQALFTERTRFWEHEGLFFQLTAVWNRDMPAGYEIEFYQSPDSRFEEEVAHAPFPAILGEPQNPLDAVGVDDLFTSLLEDARAAGAHPGAEIVVSRVLDGVDGALHELTTLNGQLINWSFPEGLCLVDGSGDFLDCNCDAVSAHGHRH